MVRVELRLLKVRRLDVFVSRLEGLVHGQDTRISMYINGSAGNRAGAQPRRLSPSLLKTNGFNRSQSNRFHRASYWCVCGFIVFQDQLVPFNDS